MSVKPDTYPTKMIYETFLALILFFQESNYIHQSHFGFQYLNNL